jgi:hypothetical protein
MFILLNAIDIAEMRIYGLVTIKERVATSLFSLISPTPSNLNSRAWLHPQMFRLEKAHIPERRTVFQLDMRENENRIGTCANGQTATFSDCFGMKKSTMRWTANVARMGEMRN